MAWKHIPLSRVREESRLMVFSLTLHWFSNPILGLFISLEKETYQLPMMVTREFSPFRTKTFFRACSRLLPLSGFRFFTQSLSSWRLGEMIKPSNSTQTRDQAQDKHGLV